VSRAVGDAHLYREENIKVRAIPSYLDIIHISDFSSFYVSLE